MATLPTRAGNVTLEDIAKALDPNGRIAAVAELLNQRNDILQDMSWLEGNLPTGQEASIRTGLPVPIWRTLYGGVPPSKSLRVKVTDTCGVLEARSEVDKLAVELSNNVSEYRLSEAVAFIEGMNQTFLQTLFYGDVTVNPERFTGLAPRFGSTGGANAQNIIKGVGATALNNMSIWLVGWSKDTVTGIYPKGSIAGLFHEDLGIIDAFDSNTPAGRFRAYADRFEWRCGLHVKDWRFVSRFCNIPQTVVTDVTGGTNYLIENMAKMTMRIPNLKACTPAFYCNRTIYEMLRIQAMNKSVAALSLVEGYRQFETVYMGIPIRICDQLLTTENVVV